MAHGGLEGFVPSLNATVVTRLVPESGTAAVYVLQPWPVAAGAHSVNGREHHTGRDD